MKAVEMRAWLCFRGATRCQRGCSLARRGAGDASSASGWIGSSIGPSAPVSQESRDTMRRPPARRSERKERLPRRTRRWLKVKGRVGRSRRVGVFAVGPRQITIHEPIAPRLPSSRSDAHRAVERRRHAPRLRRREAGWWHPTGRAGTRRAPRPRAALGLAGWRRGPGAS